MTRWVVDASVAIKWVSDEELSEQAVSLISDDVELLAPDLLLIECCGALANQVRARRLTEPGAERCLRDLLESPLALQAATPPLLTSSLRIARQAGIAAADALYLALAEDRDAIVVTADARMANSVRQHAHWKKRVVHLGAL